VTNIGPYGCSIDRKEVLAGALLGPGDELPGNTNRSEPVSPRNLSLLTLSVVNRRPVVEEQASAAFNACRCRFPAGGSCTVMRTFVLCRRIVGGAGNNRDPQGRGQGRARGSVYVCPSTEGGAGCGRW
jgi:hypothetical protein